MCIIEEYINCVLELDNINKIGTYDKKSVKRNNILAKRLHEISLSVIGDSAKESEFVKLLKHRNENVRLWCAHCVIENSMGSDLNRKQAFRIISTKAKVSVGERIWVSKWKNRE